LLVISRSTTVSVTLKQRQHQQAHGHVAVRAQQAWQRGRELSRSARLKDAIIQFRQATKLCPGDSLYWLNLASTLRKAGEIEEALQSAKTAFELDRTSPVACQLLADLLAQMNRSSDMLAVIESLDGASERDARYYLLKGSALSNLRRWEEAAQCYLSAMASGANENWVRRKALVQLGQALARLERYGDAMEAYRTALIVEPLALDAALFAAHYAAWTCDWAGLADDYERLQVCIEAVQALPDPSSIEPISPFCLLTLTDSPELMRWAAEITSPKVSGAQPKARQLRRPAGRLRIGMMSADFHHHATSMLMVEMLEKLDRQRYELYLYSNGVNDGSALRRRMEATADHFIEVEQLSNHELARRIEADEITVLFDLKGFTIGSRLHVMADRVAPVQAAWLGFPGTCGAGFVDYIVGDPVVTPLDAQAFYTEHIAQLPHCYQPNDRCRPTPEPWSRAQCGLPDDALVFASFNQSYKIIPEVFETWCRILTQVPASVLWLLVPQADIQSNLKAHASRLGLDPDRLIFAPFVNIEQHRARLPQADVILDTFPCGGHTTASDALWAGVPMVALIGSTFAARVAPSLLNSAGLPELVCSDLADYEQLAVALATDSPRRQALREHLHRARQEAPLFDSEGFARDFGALVERMVARWEQGLPPAPLAAHDAANH
jgi:predicted O-linked N-acetylglucosamine transferase (SPINDLY family)